MSVLFLMKPIHFCKIERKLRSFLLECVWFRMNVSQAGMMPGTQAAATTSEFPSLQTLPNRVKNQKCQYYIKMLLSSVFHVKKQFLTKLSEFCLHIRCLHKALPLKLRLQDTAGNNDEVIRNFFSVLSLWYGPWIAYCKRLSKTINSVCCFSSNILSAGFILQTISPDGHRT